MAASARTKVLKNNLPQIHRQMVKNIHARTDILANTAVAMCVTDLHNGRGHGGTKSLMSDTTVSEASFYRIHTNGQSNYAEKRAQMEARMWKAGKHYAGRPDNAIIFDELRPVTKPNQARAVVASMSLIMAFWEYGHNNKLTGQYESTPVISWTAFILHKRLRQHYSKIMAEWIEGTGGPGAAA